MVGLCVGIIRLWASCMTCWSCGKNKWWVGEVFWLCMQMMGSEGIFGLLVESNHLFFIRV